MPEHREATILPFFLGEQDNSRPVVVFAGLHDGPMGPPCQPSDCAVVLDNCRIVLTRARSRQLPIAFIRHVSPGREPRAHYPSWLHHFEPTKEDMVFDISQPSYYQNAEFAEMMNYSARQLVLLGYLGELDALHCAIDASQRGHRFTLISDAFACAAPLGISHLQYRSTVAEYVTAYGAVVSGSEWMSGRPSLSTSSPRRH